MRRGRLPDPAWKSGPPDPPEPTDSEHAIDPEPAGYDHDGVGVKEAEQLDGEPLHAIREAYSCHRDGCDADPTKVHLYALSDVDAEVLTVAFESITHTDAPSTEDVVEWLSMHAIVVDYDEAPILGFRKGGEESKTIGYVEPQVTNVSGFEGPCYGHEEPDPEPYSL